MKKFIPLSLSVIVLIIASVLWEYIRLPYNSENIIVGEYSLKKFNPLNETIRFLSFTLFPAVVYLISYLFINKKTYNLNIKSHNYFLDKKEVNSENSLNIYFYLFIILISVDFFLLDFNNFVNTEDLFHEIAYLVPPLNYAKNKELFNSTFYDYGLIAHNLGFISKYFLGYYSIGSIKFTKLLLVFLIKFSLILIIKKISTDLKLNDIFKKIFFIFLTFFAISLPSYFDFQSNFSFRHSFYLFFIFILGSTLCDNKNLNLKFFTIGVFSLISMLWWYDIGALINSIIIFSIIYLLIHNEIKSVFFIIFGTFLSWELFFLIMPVDEIKEFIFQIKVVYSTGSTYLSGIEYRAPFSAESGRWTKALLIIYITSLMLVNLNFSKKFYVNYKTKVFINLLFVSGVFVFKSALTRSDSYHLKYSSGIYTLVFVFVLFLFFFQRLEANKKLKDLIKNIQKKTISRTIFSFYIIFSFLFLSGIFDKRNNATMTKKIQNFTNSKINLTHLFEAEDSSFLNENDKSVLKYYKEISKGDDCTQIFSDKAEFSYLLKKPSCTQFYSSIRIMNGYTENKFINQLKLAAPNIILYKSLYNIQTNYSNMPNATKYIEKEYSFYKNYNDYIFYKKN